MDTVFCPLQQEFLQLNELVQWQLIYWIKNNDSQKVNNFFPKINLIYE